MARFGLIGKSLVHSFSVGYFREKFLRDGSAHTYENFELASIEQFLTLLANNPDIKGLNVTIPYKEAIIPYLDELDPVAKEIGAVNTVLISGDKTMGFNTDVIGFKNSLKPFLKHGMEKALILGTGGASKAVHYVLKNLGIDCFFVSRDSNAQKTFSYQMLNEEAMKQFKLIINTTPVGTFPNIEQAPELPYASIGPDHLFYDLIYNPEETVFLRRAREGGAVTINGLGMLKAQAEASYHIWLSEAE